MTIFDQVKRNFGDLLLWAIGALVLVVFTDGSGSPVTAFFGGLIAVAVEIGVVIVFVLRVVKLSFSQNRVEIQP